MRLNLWLIERGYGERKKGEYIPCSDWTLYDRYYLTWTGTDIPWATEPEQEEEEEKELIVKKERVKPSLSKERD